MMMAAEAEQQRPGRQGERLKKAEWLTAEGTPTTPVGFREDAGFVALMMKFSLALFFRSSFLRFVVTSQMNWPGKERMIRHGESC
jgi:hypothetical protein